MKEMSFHLICQKWTASVAVLLSVVFHLAFCRGGTELPTEAVVVIHFEDIDAAGELLYRGVFTVDWLSPWLSYMLGAVVPWLLLVFSCLTAGTGRVLRYSRFAVYSIVTVIPVLSLFPAVYGPIPAPLVLLMSLFGNVPDRLVPFVPFFAILFLAAVADLCWRRSETAQI